MKDVTRSAALKVQSVHCDECTLGRVYSNGRGGFCPRLLKELAPNEILLNESQPDGRVWFVKEGVFAIEAGERVHLLLPGSLICIEDLRRYGEGAVIRALTRSKACWAPVWVARACPGIQPETAL